MLNVVSEHWVLGGDIGGGGVPRCTLGTKSKKIKVLFGHFRINKISYSRGNTNHRITVNYSLDFRAQWRGVMGIQI